MTVQLPACDRCTQGVMDATNDHARGSCSCPCHERIVCPRCEGQRYDVGSCSLCDNRGWLVA